MTFTLAQLAGANAGTLFTGIGKTGIPGATILGAVLLAAIHPEARASVGVLLPLLVVADVLAVYTHHRGTNWRLVARILPWILVGIAVGGVVLERVRGPGFPRLLGALVLGLLALEQARQRLGWHGLPHHPVYAAMLGIAGGITTTLGNLAGPVLSLYFLSLGLDKQRFMGGFAWIFLVINLVKMPLYAGLGLLHAESLRMSVSLLPGLLLGAWLGRQLFHRLPEKLFGIVVQVLAAASALHLLLRG